MTGCSTVWGRAVVALVACATLLPACGSADEPTVAVRAQSTSAPPSVEPRTVPTPVNGALRADVLAQRDEADGPSEVLLFGDSVAVLIADELAAELDTTLYVDGVDCRRLDLAFEGPCGGVPAGTAVPTGLDALRDTLAELRDAGEPPDAAVLIIANNAALHADDLDAAMAALTEVARVWWVTTDVAGRAWRDPNNALLADLARRDDRAGLIDWFAAARHEDWRADHVHPNETGQLAMSALIADHLRCDCVP